MKLLHPEQRASLREWFAPERPGPLIGAHVINSGNGAIFVDRWPETRAVLADAGGNYVLLGQPSAFTPTALADRIHGVVEAGPEFESLLRAAFPDLQIWPRLIFEQPDAPELTPVTSAVLYRLQGSDAHHLWGLTHHSAWISKTWGGPIGLASSGMAWGAFVDGELASVACTFFLGDRHEDIGVVTEPTYRGLGLSTACAAALSLDIRARGHRATWATAPENTASRRVAKKLGMRLDRRDVLYVAGVHIPAPPD